MVGRQLVAPDRDAADEDQPGLERPGPRDGPEPDGDLDGPVAERLHAVRQVEPDLLDELDDAPATTIGAVSTRSRPARSLASPSTLTTVADGDRCDLEARGGRPADDRRDRQGLRPPIGEHRHADPDLRGLDLDRSAAPSGSPFDVDRDSGTSSLTSTPVASIDTSAWTSETVATTDCGPLTMAVAPSTIGSPASRPDGIGPTTAPIGTSRLPRLSTVTEISRGSKSRTWIRGSTASTVDVQRDGLPGRLDAREVHRGRKVDLSIRRPRSGGAT